MRNCIKHILLSYNKLHTRGSPTLVPCSSKRQPGWGSGGPVVRHFFFHQRSLTPFFLIATINPSPTLELHLPQRSLLAFISNTICPSIISPFPSKIKSGWDTREVLYWAVNFTGKLKFTRMISLGINWQKMCIFPPTCRRKLPLVSCGLQVPFGIKGHNWEKNPVRVSWVEDACVIILEF